MRGNYSRMPKAKDVAAQMASLSKLYGVSRPAHQISDENAELRFLLDQERQRSGALQGELEQLQGALEERNAQVRELEGALAAASASAVRGGGGGGGGSPSYGRADRSALQAENQLFMKARGLEAENQQLRSVAAALQSQRDAFESVARQLQSHSMAVESAFTALQSEAQDVFSHARGLEDAMARARRTQSGYETGLGHLLMLLGKQQEKIKRCVLGGGAGRRRGAIFCAPLFLLSL